jgi:hypothetical protein
MEPETLKLIIPIMALLIPFFAIWTKHQRKLEEIRTSAFNETNAQAAVRAAAQRCD